MRKQSKRLWNNRLIKRLPRLKPPKKRLKHPKPDPERTDHDITSPFPLDGVLVMFYLPIGSFFLT
jgi:hypothetical protein